MAIMIKKKKSNDVFEDGQQGAEEGKKNTKMKTRILVFCVLGFLILYAVLVSIESAAVNDYKNYEVTTFIPAQVLEKNTKVTNENVHDLFQEVTRDSRILPDDYISNPMDLIGQYAKMEIELMEIIHAGSFQEIDMSEGITNPVEVSFSVNNFDQVVGGILREGDRINLYVIRKEKDETGEQIVSEPIIKDTYITKAFTNTGLEVKKEDTANGETPTTVINVYIPRDKEETFHKAVIEGTLRVSKIMD